MILIFELISIIFELFFKVINKLRHYLPMNIKEQINTHFQSIKDIIKIHEKLFMVLNIYSIEIDQTNYKN
jgi:hypothetical protein